jgi:hypothetical protein
MKYFSPLLYFGMIIIFPSYAQFIDHFDGPYHTEDPAVPAGWSVATGDGEAEIDFLQMDGYASVRVDAASDKRNIWWAVIRREVPGLNMQELIKPGKELRVEARIRVSHAPRRVNLHFNHQRTTDFHSHLMEFDIPDTAGWHTISMTTRDFETQPGDRINVQMALMDWGREKYRVDIDYIKVDVVDSNAIRNDLGNKLPYHPTVADPGTFTYHKIVAEDAVIDSEYPELNFNNWGTKEDTAFLQLLTVSGTQTVILRWDLSSLKGKKVAGPGLLELTTYSLLRSADYQKDFGMIRVTEILAGDPEWDQNQVTFDLFTEGTKLDEVLNTQMIIDYEVNPEKGGKSLFTISQFVLQRIIDGRTKGIAISPLGAVNASFYTMEWAEGKFAPKLHFNIER